MDLATVNRRGIQPFNHTHHGNFTSDHDQTFSPAPLWMRVVAICLTSTSATFGCLGNLAVLLAFARSRSMWIKQNIYVLCLTTSDLVLTTYVNTQDLQQFLLGYWPHSRSYCRIHLTLVYLTYISSLNLVVLISRDRMLMVVKGLGYASYESGRRKWLLAIINVFYVLIGLFFWANYDLVSDHKSIFDTTGRCRPEQQQNLYVTIFHQAVFAVLPVMLMLYYYAYVRRHMRIKVHGGLVPKITHGRNYASQHPSSNIVVQSRARNLRAEQSRSTNIMVGSMQPQGTGQSGSDDANNSKRAVRTMNVLILCALCFGMPFTTLSMVMNVLVASPTLVTPSTYDWWSRLYELTFLICFVHGAVNPFLYAYAMPAYRAAVKNGIVWLWKCISSQKN